MCFHFAFAVVLWLIGLGLSWFGQGSNTFIVDSDR